MGDTAEKKFANAFALTGRVGPRGFQRLQENFISMEKAWSASAHELAAAGFSSTDAETVISRRREVDPDAAWEELVRERVAVLTSKDAEYPALLRTIADPPFILYIRGILPKDAEKLMAVVGTRKPSAYGRETGAFFARELCRAGFSIVSGMAEGIDTIAHEAALAEGAHTYAIVGTGLDDVYPPTNRSLAERIPEQGALISEFPLHTPPFKSNFPQRNRIVSGLSMGTLVVEARKKSGALITGELALEQGREVFAIPGPIFAKTSAGTNCLIQQGAKLAMDINDILGEFGFEAVGKIGQAYVPRHPEEETLLAYLEEGPKHLDILIRETNLKVSEVHTTLTLLEINGVVEHLGGNIYTIKR